MTCPSDSAGRNPRKTGLVHTVPLALNMLKRLAAWEGYTMTKRLGATLALVLLLAPATARAQIYQTGSSKSTGNSTVNFTIGYFALRGLESRVPEDVLLADLQNLHPLLFEINDFNSAVFGGDRSRLCRGRTIGRFLGSASQSLGHLGRSPPD